jgi:microcystin degradation protein MlrC
MNVGILALMHESNTFLRTATGLDQFVEDVLLSGEAVRKQFLGSHHELGGFFAGLAEQPAAAKLTFHAVPLFAARALPAGPIDAEAFDTIVDQLLESVRMAPPLDGLLVAVHGAAVSQHHLDADGYWLSRLRQLVGPTIPIIATLDAHANLSKPMVDACDALIAYRTNPHLDQRQRGVEAATLMRQVLHENLRLTMAACWPPLCINIDRQCTDQPHWAPLYELADQQRSHAGVLSNSILLGFPYADVPELGASTIVVTRNDQALAERLAKQLSDALWDARQSFCGQLMSVDQSLDLCAELTSERICLLDMGDNVGGGSAGDGTELCRGLLERGLGPSFVCIFDPEAVKQCERAGIGATCKLSIGGKTDDQHGAPISMTIRVDALCDGAFHEAIPRHGGMTHFDQGRTALVRTNDTMLTVMLTSRRMVPFSLRQLTALGVEPRQFRILVAKGVNAPIAAYREVCDRFLQVNTCGGTCADLRRLEFHHRRTPLFPFELDATN